MMSQITGLFVFVLSMALFGCASKGFNRGELAEQIGTVKPVYSDQEIKAAFGKKPNLPKSFKLAIYFKAPKKARGMDGEWRWTEQDKAMFDEIGKELRQEGLVADVFPIVGALVADEDMKSLRMAAAQHHADALLVVGGAGAIDRYINNWGWTYALLVPAFLVPGSEADTLFIANASLWDVRNEYLYLTAEAEAMARITYIAAFGKQEKELVDPVKTAALGNLKTELKKMLKGAKL